MLGRKKYEIPHRHSERRLTEKPCLTHMFCVVYASAVLILGGSHAHDLTNDINTTTYAEYVVYVQRRSVLFCGHSFDFYSLSESIFHTCHSSRHSGCVSSAHIVGVKCRGSNFTNKKRRKRFQHWKISSADRLKFCVVEWNRAVAVPIRRACALCNYPKSEMDSTKWDEELFRDKSWRHVDSEFKKDFDTIERVFFIFFGIIFAIVICVFILVVFMICYRLCKGDRNQLYRRPFYNVPTARPTHACNTIWYIPSNFILFASEQQSYHKYYYYYSCIAIFVI